MCQKQRIESEAAAWLDKLVLHPHPPCAKTRLWWPGAPRPLLRPLTHRGRGGEEQQAGRGEGAARGGGRGHQVGRGGGVLSVELRLLQVLPRHHRHLHHLRMETESGAAHEKHQVGAIVL